MDWIDEKFESSSARFLIYLGMCFVALLICLGLVRVTFFTFVDNYQEGYMYDARTGKITILDRTGYFFAWPLLENIHTVDLRPMQVQMNANNRVLNAKLVKFNPKGLMLFLSWHGRKDYDGDSSGMSSTGSFNDILKSYAFDPKGRSYPFLTILRELSPGDMNITFGE